MPCHRSVCLAAACVAVLAIGAPASAQAQLRAVPDSRQQVTLSFAPVAARTAPAVVNVFALKSSPQGGHPFIDDPFFRRFSVTAASAYRASECSARSARA